MTKEMPPAYDASQSFPSDGGHHPPPPPPPGPIPQTSQTVIITTTSHLHLGPEPTGTTCPFCHAAITTDMKVQPNTKTHLFSLLLCFVGGLLCFWIPYCVDSCQSKKHYCPNCKAYLGEYTD